ncbi:MAG: hypothetical protein Kow0047_11640 [Anaerolineae bacterium]
MKTALYLMRQIIVTTGIWLIALTLGSQAQSPVEPIIWRPPELIHATEGDIQQPSVILADPWGRTHLFWVEAVSVALGREDRYPLWYMRLEDGEWTDPVDIALSQEGPRTSNPAVVLDDAGRFHVIWGAARPIEYTTALLDEALNARAWTMPIAIGGSRVAEADLQMGRNGEIIVAFAEFGEGVYIQQMDLKTGVWSAPSLIIPPISPEASPENVLIRVDDEGRWHLIWSEVAYPAGYPPVAAYYAWSDDLGQGWSPVQRLVSGGYRAEDAVINGEQVHVLLIGQVGVNERLHIYSPDRGQTWSPVYRIVPPEMGAGLNGGSLALDSLGRIHAVIGMQSDHSVGHAMWTGSQWVGLRAISGSVEGTLEDVHMTIAQGNRIQAMFVSDHQEMWWVEGKIDAPELTTPPPPQPTAATPTATALSIAPIEENVTSTPAEPPATPPTPLSQDRPSSLSTQAALILGTLPAILFVFGVSMIHVSQSRRRR